MATSRAKRVLDIVLAGSALLALSPILLCVALAIKLTSRGPALFKQERYGLHKSRFMIYKFRSMTVTEEGASARQASRGDARITKVGSFIRRTSIDELPQLWNVVRGDMSLVGPRPHPTALDDDFEPKILGYAQRYETRPGLTGLAQVRGQRGATETTEVMHERVTSDVEYINTWSFGRDIRLIAGTVRVLAGDVKAY